MIQFKSLDTNVILNVVDKFLIELEAQLDAKKVTMTVSDNARKWLAKKGYDPIMGARPMARVIQDEIKQVLADELLFGKLTSGGATLRSLSLQKERRESVKIRML